MTALQQTRIIAKWEFLRFFKWKSEIISLLITAVLFSIALGGKGLLDWIRGLDKTAIAVVYESTEQPGLELPETFEIVPSQGQSKAELMEQLKDGDLDGILVLKQGLAAELTVFSQPGWADAVTQELSRLQFQRRLDHSQLTMAEFQELTGPPDLDVVYHPAGSLPSSGTQTTLAVFVLILPLYGVFIAFSYFFVSITSEKQQRVSEQLISAVSAQTWLDGKLAGLSLFCFKSMMTSMLYMVVSYIIYLKFTGRWEGFELGAVDPVSLVWAFLFMILALVYWSAVMAALAATISDPNTSTRSSLMLLPAVIMGLPFFALDAFDSPGVIVLSIFPLTSMAFMPMRIMLSTVPIWQLLLSAALLIAMIYLLRSAAGKILGISMMMYGKEPSLKELWHWARVKMPG